MPRQPRDDLEPIIRMHPNLNDQTRRAREAIEPNFGAVVYDRGSPIGRDRRIQIFDTLEERLAHCRSIGLGLDEGLLSFMMRHCDLADTREQQDKNGDLVIENGLGVYRLVSVGCRIRMTQDEIGQGYGVSRDHVNKQIKKLRDWFFITNQGRGWYEFDANLCWRGSLATCGPFRDVQRVNDEVEEIDGNNETKNTEVDEIIEAAE